MSGADCEFAEFEPHRWRCEHCGWVYPLPADKPPRRNCPALRKRRWLPLLGDAIAWLTGLVGIKPCCRCKRRKKKLNRLDKRFRWWVKRIIAKYD